MRLVRAKDGYRKAGDKYLLAKKCTKCGRWLVASTVNFHRAKKGRCGLEARCKECINKKNERWREANPEYNKQYREANREKIAERERQWREANPEYNKQYREANREKLCEYGKQYREANKDKMAEQSKRWREANKDKIAEYNKEYREANKEKLAETNKQWYEANKDKRLEYYKQYREANRDKRIEQNKRWYETNREKQLERAKQYRQSPQGQAVKFNSHNKRRHKKATQGTGVTGDQWLEMMQYFDWRCAYTGKRLTKKTRSGDHIVPIDAGGDDMVWNVVPMLRNLNSSKCAKDMLEWYREQSFYDPKRLAKIYEWQEYAYNKWGKDTQYFNTNDIQITLL